MNKYLLSVIMLFLFGVSAFLTSTACKNSGPTTPYDLPFTSTPTMTFTSTITSTPTSTSTPQLMGSVLASVQDKNLAVPGLVVEAIPPSGSITYSQTTAISR